MLHSPFFIDQRQNKDTVVILFTSALTNKKLELEKNDKIFSLILYCWLWVEFLTSESGATGLG